MVTERQFQYLKQEQKQAWTNVVGQGEKKGEIYLCVSHSLKYSDGI